MARHLLIRLSSPLIAFGGQTIDNLGIIRDFPALSMVTGLIANALGWDRGDDLLLNQLQERLRIGSRLETPSSQLNSRLVDFQTAKLGANDKGWTTWGEPEGRGGKVETYENPHLRYRHYHTELTVLLALRLEPAGEEPTLDSVAQALDQPQRPLFIGRKPCLPTGRLVAGWIEADSLLQALQIAPPIEPIETLEPRSKTKNSRAMRAQWPEGEGLLAGDRSVNVCDERNWTSSLHGGWRAVREGLIKNVEVAK